MLSDRLSKLQQSLSRVTTSGRYIAEVDGLRFMAIIPVLIQHLSERVIRYSPIEWSQNISTDPVAFWASRGTIGVFIFFAISGFILGLPFANHHLNEGKKVKIKSYFWRRVTRLEPPYVIWMLLFFVVLVLKGGQSINELLPHLGASLGYFHNIAYVDYSVINPVAWSLEIEIQFYLLAPMLAWLFFRAKHKLLRRSIMIGSIIGLLFAQNYFAWSAMPYKLTILWQLHYFLIGFLIADFYLTDWKKETEQKAFPLLDMVAAVAFVVMCYYWATDLHKRIFFALALSLFMIAGFRSKWFTSFLRRPWIAIIGGMCYTIYLIHLPLLEGLSRFSTKLHITNHFWANLSLQALLLIPIVLVVSAVGFMLIEKPCMDKNWPTKLKNYLSQDRSISLTTEKTNEI